MKPLQVFIIWFSTLSWITTVQATEIVTIRPNSSQTVGTIETKPYRQLENLEVILSAETNCIGVGAFKDFKNLRSVTYNGTNPVQIAAGAFCGCCNLTNLSIPVTGAIGRKAFVDCTALTELDLSYATYLSPQAFVNCPNLQKVRIYEKCVGIAEAFENCPKVQIEKVNSLVENSQDFDSL